MTCHHHIIQLDSGITAQNTSTAVAIWVVTCGKVWRGPVFEVGQPPVDHVFVRTTGSQAAVAARIGARLGGRKLGELLEELRWCFGRIEPFLQARKYVRAVMSEMPKRNGWTVAEHVGDRTPDKTQRLLNRACWDEGAVMAEIRRFAVSGLEDAARKGGRKRGKLVIGALNETGQQKKGDATAVSTPAYGLRGPGGERDQHGAPVVCARRHRACVDRVPAVDPRRAHQRSGDVAAYGTTVRSAVPHQGTVGYRPLHDGGR